MDGVGYALAQSLRQKMSPVVMVLSTPRAEESCQRNGLSFVELLRPFCSLGNINVPVRTASEQSYRLTEFQIRMFYSSEICQLRPEVAEEFLAQVVNDSNDEISGELNGDYQDVELMKMIAEADLRAPAFQDYSREFMRTLGFSEHEAVDHPVACILVVSSSDVNPVSKFVDLYRADQLPALSNDGTMDPKLLKLYVMLHDHQDGPVDRAKVLLLDMRSSFGVNNCRLLCINSASPDSLEAETQSDEDIWELHSARRMAQSSVLETSESVDSRLKTKRGSYTSKMDMEELTDFVLDLSLKDVIPLMEVKIRSLYQQVSATRKGLKNQIKNLWLRKGKDDVPDVANGPQYTYASMESQIRVLADYCFMLHDYELALSSYRLLASDYKNDKAWKRYAGVQEMIGLSLFMLDQSRRESELCMETAINYYQKGGPSSASYATRASLWLAEMHKAKSQFREAAMVLSRASSEEASPRAGLLLEQGAYCYLRTTPPMLRKYGFHLVLAGNQYANCFQRKLATHVYRSALCVFARRDWNYIHDHIYFHLGRLATLLGNHASAVQFFKEVIASSHQSPANQAKFLSEFLFVIQSTGFQGDKFDLELPEIDVERVRVHCEDQRTYASLAAFSVPESTWSSLEEGLVPASDKAVLTWLDAKTKTPKRPAEESRICVAGEEIGVDVEFSNPLQVPLHVSEVSLVCQFTTDQSGMQQQGDENEPLILAQSSSNTTSSQPGKDPRDNTYVEEGDTSVASVTVSKEEFSLNSAEKAAIRLKVTPLQAGILKITGVRWTLSGIAIGQRDFAIRESKKNSSRKKNNVIAAPQRHLKFQVLAHMPRLDVSLHEVPVRVNAGEVRRLVLELSNPSTASLKTIKIKTSHPRFLLVGESGDLDQEFPGCLELQREPPAVSGLQHALDVEQECSTSGFAFSFPEDTSLEGGSTLLWPLWLHATESGTISLNTVIYYEPDKSSTGLHYRTVCLTHSLQVSPSLKVGVQITPSPLELYQFVLRLDIENKHSSESFWLRQVSCAGNQWSLGPLPPPVVENSDGNLVENVDDRAAFLSASVCPSQLLPANQNLSLFFKLLNVGAGKLAATDGLVRNLKLGLPSSTESFIDVSSGPLSRFFLREKLDQPKPSTPHFLKRQAVSDSKSSGKTRTQLPSSADADQEVTVDIILISEQQDGISEQPDITKTGKRVASLQDTVRMVMHDICNCSVRSPVPLAWLLEAPTCVGHDFSSEPFCEVSLRLKIRNCSIFDASVNIETFDTKLASGATLSQTLEKRVGWFPLAGPSSNSELSTSDSGSGSVLAALAEEEKLPGVLHCGPYMWSKLLVRSIPILRAGSSTEVPLCVAFFAPGTYDLSSYQISWSLLDIKANSQTQAAPETVLGPTKPTKHSETTYANGFAPAINVVSRLGASPSSRGIKTVDRMMSGIGQGHSLLVTVLGT